MRRRVRPPPERSLAGDRGLRIPSAGFTDTLFVSEADTVQMIEAFARYIAVLSDRPADSAPMDSLMRRASSSKPMLDYFAMLAGTVLHDPNSPLRNDEFYIPVLRAQLASPFYDEYERIAPQYDLEMAMQNRLGQPANDFRYTLASGASGTLYGLQAEYVLLFSIRTRTLRSGATTATTFRRRGSMPMTRGASSAKRACTTSTPFRPSTCWTAASGCW